MQPIVITGMGVVSPLGNDLDTFWRQLQAGVCGIRPLTRFDTAGFTYTHGGEVADLAIPAALAAAADNEDLATRFLLVAAHQAIAQAGLANPQLPPAEVAVVVATNFGGSAALEGVLAEVAGHGSAQPDDFRRAQLQAGADALANQWGFCGIRNTLSLSCSSGTAALAVGADLLRLGRAKAVIVAGYDAISRFAWLGLGALRTITLDQVRPFDKNRAGTIFSEGAGVIVLEMAADAAARGAVALVEFAGGATNNNAFHITAPAKEGAGSAEVMRAALVDAGLAPAAVDHLNAHGTGTTANDVTETQAIKSVFGDQAYAIPITSNKAALGHLLGAAGSVEAIAAALTLRDGVIPPTIHYQTPDPECDLDLVANLARPATVDCVLSNSAGIGGCNAAVILQKLGRTSPRPDTPPHRRVVVTGIGPLTAIGGGRQAFADALAFGDDGIADAPHLATPDGWIPSVAELRDFDLKAYFAKPKGYLDRATQLAFAAAELAFADANLPPEQRGGKRAGLALGTAAGCLETAGRFFADFLDKGPRFVKPILFPHTYSNTTISMLAIEYGLAGPHLNFASGMVAGAQALIAAADQIRLGRADLMLAGGVDALSREWLLGWRQEGRISPTTAGPHLCAPFAAESHGLALGEGACLLVLEEYEHALARGAKILGEILGSGESSAVGLAAAAVERAIDQALAPLPPQTLALVLAGANGDHQLDAVEMAALQQNPATAAIPTTAIKAMLGETAGAALPLQVAAAICARQTGLIPPTLNVRTPQPGSTLNLVVDTDQPLPPGPILCLGEDFGGATAAILLAG